MQELSQKKLQELSLNDAEFLGFYWLKDSMEPTLVICIEPSNSHIVELVGIWAYNLKVVLDYQNHVGALLTWKVTIAETDNHCWVVCVDLAHQGEISFRCNKLFLRASSEDRNA